MKVINTEKKFSQKIQEGRANKMNSNRRFLMIEQNLNQQINFEKV